MRFIRRDGARLFLDSRDLIRLIEKGEPLSTAQFAAELRKRHARIVLVHSNVSELVPQNDNTPADPRRVDRLMRELETIPHTYLRAPDLGREEFSAALRAYESAKPVRPIDPYFDHWWETLWK